MAISPIPGSSTWTEAQDEYLREHYGQDLSARQIGNELCLSRNAVIGRARRLGIEVVPRPRNPERPRRRASPKRGVPRPADPQPPRATEMSAELFPIVSRPVSLLQAQDHHCRAIVGERDGIALYCGADKQSGSSFCPGHYARFYLPMRRATGEPVKLHVSPLGAQWK
ncbi:MAG TPA: GcrA family cell cycle regulator [Terracidiphilus sp.]